MLRHSWLLAILLAACATTAPVSDRVRFIDATDARLKAPDQYFGVEYGRINARRAHFKIAGAEGNARPPKIVGLALSGGGIRSNAFQLGVLAGLHGEPFQDVTLLDRVDYISSVSGGTWANLALWAWPGDVNALFDCLDSGAANGVAQAKAKNSACADALLLLRTEQNVELLPLGFGQRQRKEAWQQDIEKAALKLCNPSFIKALPQGCAQDMLLTRPYFIVNSTHDSPEDHPKVSHFPFETTPDGIATVVDSGSKTANGPAPAAGPVGFTLPFAAAGEQWQRRKFAAARIPGGDNGLSDGSLLSMTAAHSSAVIEGAGGGLRALFLDFYFQLSNDGKRVADDRGRLRKRYVLADGGKSDDTGLVPLIDRGADIVVASYMGKDSVPFDDFDLAAQQADKLFGCKARDVEDRTPSHPISQPGMYSCPSAPVTAGKPILHVHPWLNNVAEFRRSLNDDLAKYLTNVDDKLPAARHFPQTKTFQTHYDEELIRSYYLLGKFVAKHDIASFLRQQIAAQ